MRFFLALALGCVLVAGCGGGGSSANSSTALTPSTSNGSTTNTGTTSSARMLALNGFVMRWYSESPLALLNDISFACAQGIPTYGFTPDFNRVYAGNAPAGGGFVSNNVFEFDGANYKQLRTFNVGALSVNGVAVTPDDTKLYVAARTQGSSPQDLIEVIDLSSGKIVKTITLSESSSPVLVPEWIAMDHTGAHAYVYSDDFAGHMPYYSFLTRINTADDSVSYTTPINISSYSGDDARISADDTTLDLIDVSTQTYHAIDTTSGSTVATRAIFPDVVAGFDDSKSGSNLFYGTPIYGNTWQLKTLDSRTLALKNTVALPNLSYVNAVAASSTGNVFLAVNPLNSSVENFEEVNPSTGAVLQSTSSNAFNLEFQIFAQ